MTNRIVFFGTPWFAARVLRHLLEHRIQIVGVVTQPDRPKGRSLQVAPSAVKEVVFELAPHLPILQPEKASEEPFLEKLASLKADLFVVAAFGQILPERLLALPPLGCINVHTSLLPKYRGAAPIQRALMAGESETGVTIQKMVKKLDAGDIVLLEKVSIPLEMTFGELEGRLCEVSQSLLLKALTLYESGEPSATAQNHELATYAHKIALEDGKIDWTQPASTLHHLIRAFSPRPGAWASMEGGSKKLKVLRARLVEGSGLAGHILSREGIVACGVGALQLLEVQPEGKKTMPAADWLRGVPHLKKI